MLLKTCRNHFLPIDKVVKQTDVGFRGTSPDNGRTSSVVLQWGPVLGTMDHVVSKFSGNKTRHFAIVCVDRKKAVDTRFDWENEETPDSL